MTLQPAASHDSVAASHAVTVCHAWPASGRSTCGSLGSALFLPLPAGRRLCGDDHPAARALVTKHARRIADVRLAGLTAERSSISSQSTRRRSRFCSVCCITSAHPDLMEVCAKWLRFLVSQPRARLGGRMVLGVACSHSVHRRRKVARTNCAVARPANDPGPCDSNSLITNLTPA